MASEYPNRRIISLAEWEACKEEEKNEEKEVYFIEVQEEVVEEANERELLVLRRAWNSQKGQDAPSMEKYALSSSIEGVVQMLLP